MEHWLEQYRGRYLEVSLTFITLTAALMVGAIYVLSYRKRKQWMADPNPRRQPREMRSKNRIMQMMAESMPVAEIVSDEEIEHDDSIEEGEGDHDEE